MPEANFPSVTLAHRRADMVVHFLGLLLVVLAGGALLLKSFSHLQTPLIAAVVVYVLSGLATNRASWAYHFLPWHDRRTLLRRIDHAAIYLSITGTFTPFFVVAGTQWSFLLIWLCWGLTAVAVWNKITNPVIKSRWSTASYLALGALGLTTLPSLAAASPNAIWFVFGGAVSYVVGVAFYARRSMPYRYAIWHVFVNLGALMMLLGVWTAVFSTS